MSRMLPIVFISILLFATSLSIAIPVERAISLDLSDTAIENALRIISEISKLSIAPIDEIQGRITYQVVNKPWEECLSEMLAKFDATYVIEGSVIRIYKRTRKRVAAPRPFTARPISLDLADTDITNALRIIEEVSAMKISYQGVSSPSGKVTIRLIDVPWDQALDIFLEPHDLRAEIVGGSIRISPRSHP